MAHIHDLSSLLLKISRIPHVFRFFEHQPLNHQIRSGMMQAERNGLCSTIPQGKNMKWITLVFALSLTIIVSTTAQAEERRAVYVGEGRHACSDGSADCAVLKQRNQEQTRRAQERNENDRQNDRAERREREYQRDYESSRY